MKVAFKIPPSLKNSDTANLLIEVCDMEITFFIFQENPFIILGLYKYQFEKYISSMDYVGKLKSILAAENEVLQNFTNTKIYYNTSESTLVPAKYFLDADKEYLLNLMYGLKNECSYFQENTNIEDVKIIYRVDQIIYEYLQNSFIKSSFSHATSFEINNIATDENKLQCTIYSSFIKITLYKKDKLQLVQYFNYETPTDVSYHLLNVCERFYLSLNTVKIIVDGAIEIKSNLYEDMHKYFLDISFANISDDVSIAENLRHLPNHFFAHFITLALCV